MPYPQKQVSDPATARRRLILYKLALPHSLPCHRPFLPFIFRRLASALRSATRLSHHDDHKNCQPKFLHAFSPIAIHTIFQSGSVIQLSPEIVNALNPLPLSPNLNPNHSPYPKLYTPPQKKEEPTPISISSIDQRTSFLKITSSLATTRQNCSRNSARQNIDLLKRRPQPL